MVLRTFNSGAVLPPLELETCPEGLYPDHSIVQRHAPLSGWIFVEKDSYHSRITNLKTKDDQGVLAVMEFPPQSPGLSLI